MVRESGESNKQEEREKERREGGVPGCGSRTNFVTHIDHLQ